MPAAPASLGLELGFASSAASDTGDNIIETGSSFSVDFGDKAAARNANAGGSNALGGLTNEIIKGVAVALAARLVWQWLK